MSTLVFTDAKIYLGGYNLSGYTNETDIQMPPAMLNNTVFGMSTMSNRPGLHDLKANVKGFNDFTIGLPPSPHPTPTSSVDSVLQARIGAVEEVFSVAPVGNAELDLAYFFKGVNGKYDPMSAAHGQLVPFAIDVSATGIRAIRGYTLGLGTKIATGQSAAGKQIVGGTLAGQLLYAALHVVAAAGTTPTLDAIIQSDDNAGFSSPTTRLTFPQFTTSVGASWQSLAGPITDDYYRLKWTITGTLPQYTIFGVFGVL